MSQRTQKNIFVQLADLIHNLHEATWLELNFACKLLDAEIPPEHREAILRELRAQGLTAVNAQDNSLLHVINEAIAKVRWQTTEGDAAQFLAGQTGKVTDAVRIQVLGEMARSLVKGMGNRPCDSVSSTQLVTFLADVEKVEGAGTTGEAREAGEHFKDVMESLE